MIKPPFLAIILLFAFDLCHAAEVDPFKTKCVQGETHRYDGGNGKDVSGRTIANPGYGWSTEKWGNLEVVWSGGNTIVIGKLIATVLQAQDGIILAHWSEQSAWLTNLASLLLDTVLGEAVYSESQVTMFGESRSIKTRSQNLKCEIVWLN
jgi:hypothetical protein